MIHHLLHTRCVRGDNNPDSPCLTEETLVNRIRKDLIVRMLR